MQDDAGNLSPVFQVPGLEFIIEFSSDIQTFMFQGTQPVVRGINTCNTFFGPYNLIDGLLTIDGLAQDEDDCFGPFRPIQSIIDRVLIFSGGATSMVSINAEGNVLTIASGANEVLFFDVSNEPFPTF